MVHQRCVLEPHVTRMQTASALKMNPIEDVFFFSFRTSHHLILCLFTLEFSRPQRTLTWEGWTDGCAAFSLV